MASPEIAYSKARRVQQTERDRMLGIDQAAWPQAVPAGWALEDGFLRRTVTEDAKTPALIPHRLEEMVLRFPSAPLHGLQRLNEHHMTLPASENYHTFRLLRSADPATAAGRVTRIFLMHNGLNECANMGLYYRLASHLTAREPGTVCIVRPFPGHLTRFPFQAFAETPLDNYLWDGSHLFRQFLRYMIETQWFLSALVRRSSYRAASGANLLGESNDIDSSRLNATVLADEILDVWTKLQQASAATAAAEQSDESDPDRPVVSGPITNAEPIEDAITTLRSVMGLDTDYPRLGGELGENDQEPAVHVLGYSLGGFTAQSVFMSWPFTIASCATVLAGGPLRELAPTDFAHPEEWQTVLHSLRYELDDRLMSEHLGTSADEVAGLNRDLFTYFKRTFYDVFQQEYRGSFQTRLEAFRQRMLFIVGGNDPVVRPKSVLDSAPKGGLNLLEIGGLGHFLEGQPRDPEQRHQQAFWQPEMAAFIHRFANNAAEDQAAQRPYTWFDKELQHPAQPMEAWDRALRADPGARVGKEAIRRLTPAELVAISGDGALPGDLFERALDDLLARVATQGDDGALFILRNEIPTILLHPSIVRETAAALYHDDFGITRYCHGVTARREALMKHLEKICFVFPWNARRIMGRIDLRRGYPSQSESAGGQVAPRLAEKTVWKYSEDLLRTMAGSGAGKYSVRRFNGNVPISSGGNENVQELLDFASTFLGQKMPANIGSLPDCWVWMSRDRIVPTRTAQVTASKAHRRLVEVVPDICESPQTMQTEIRDEGIQIVSLSRARFNPRFRGRLLVDGAAARKALLHVALCLSQSQAISDLPPDEALFK